MAGGPGGYPVPGIGLPHNPKERAEFVKSRRLDPSLKVTAILILLGLALIAGFAAIESKYWFLGIGILAVAFALLLLRR